MTHTYFLRVPDYAGDGFAEITVTASNEVEARRIANERMPPYFWDGATCVKMRGPNDAE